MAGFEPASSPGPKPGGVPDSPTSRLRRLLITSPPLSAGEDSETIYFIAVTMGVEPTFSFTYLLP